MFLTLSASNCEGEMSIVPSLETTRMSCHKELYIILRYVDVYGEIQKPFLGFDVPGNKDA